MLRVSRCQPKTSLARLFHSRAEHSAWVRKVVQSRLRKTAAEPGGSELVPLLSTTFPLADRLKISAVPNAPSGTPEASFLEIEWPIATDEFLSNATADHTLTDEPWAPFRLAKFYESLDALTADAATRHVGRDVALVTGGHYHSIKLGRTLHNENVVMRSYVTAAGGGSSIEVRTDGLQLDAKGRERLVNVCHTVMVALDRKTMRPVAVKDKVPDLVVEDEHGIARKELAELHKTIRKRRQQQALSLETALSSPPTPAEMKAVHELHRRADRGLEPISDHTHHKSQVIFPENRNTHGKTFGGYVISEAFDLAIFAARYFVRGAPMAPIGLDEATYLDPVGIGDMVTFTARVCHVGDDGVFRVFVTLGVLDERKPEVWPKRSNRLMFVFAADPKAVRTVLPTTYQDVLMHFEGARRHAVEGLEGRAKEEVRAFVSKR